MKSQGDKDWIEVELTAGVTYRVETNGQTFGAYQSLADTIFKVRDANGNLLLGFENAALYDHVGTAYETRDFVASYTGTYFISIGAGSVNYQTLTGGYSLLVSALSSVPNAPINTTPVAVNETFIAIGGQTISGNVLTHASDANGDSLYSITYTGTGSQGGLLDIFSNGSFTYAAPNVNYAGSEIFGYAVYDGRGGSGNASLQFNFQAAISNIAHFTNYDDSFDVIVPQAVYGLGGNDNIIMHTANTAYGGDGDDRMTGLSNQGANGTWLVGDAGDDWFVVDGAAIGVSGDEFNSLGEQGFDTLDLSQASAAMIMDYQQPLYGTIGGRGFNFTSINQLIGTNFNDTIYSDTTLSLPVDNDVIRGGNGDDYLYSAGGDDSVFGEADNDTLFDEAGNDYLDGGAGDDNIRSMGGGDSLMVAAAMILSKAETVTI